MNEIKTVHQCLFCSQTFDSASDKDDHILEHFAQETCTDCNQNLIRIGGYWYTRHSEATCIKEVPTSEVYDESYTHNGSVLMITEENTLQYENDNAVTMSLNLDTYESGIPQIKTEPVDRDILMNTFYLEPTLCSTHEIVPEPPTTVNILDIRNRFSNIDLNPVVVLEDIFKQTDTTQPPHPKRRKIDPLINDFETGIVEVEAQDSEQMDGHESTECCKAENEERVEVHQSNCHLSKCNENPKGRKIFECFICRKSLINKYSVIRHLKMVHDENGKKYKCEICCRAFFYRIPYQDHMNAVHLNNPRFVCNTCGKACANGTTLRVHGYIHTGEKPYKCNYEGCEKYFRTWINRNRHLKTHFDAIEKSRTVDNCDNRFTNEFDLRVHKEQQHPATIFDQNDIDTQAIEYILPNTDEPVANTIEPLPNPDDENDVRKTGDSKQNIDFIKIEELIIESPTNSDLQQVNALDTPGRSKSECHKCDDCGQFFIWRNKLEAHILRCHTGPGPFTCEICKKNFPTRCSLGRHNKWVHGPKKHKCEICESSFARPNDLRRHIDIVHLNIAKYKCDTCGMKFKRRHYLTHHERIHTGEKPFKCTYDDCGKCFRSNVERARHEVFHTDERPFACEIEGCDIAFKTPHNLKLHRERDHGVFKLVYSCEFCSDTFNGKTKLMKHIQEKHQDR